MSFNDIEVSEGVNTTGPVFPSVAIIILTWNGLEQTIECLDSLQQLDYPTDYLQIIVVDNGSTDDTVQVIRQRYPNVTVLENETNLGYAGGNNQGLRYALSQGTKYCCILNNDTTVAPDCLNRLLIVMEQSDDCGIVSPLIAELAMPKRVWALGAAVNRRTGTVVRLHTGENISTGQTLSPFEIDIAPGAAIMVRREVFEQIGFLDEAFYLYYEEADWCLRARQGGYKILAVPSAIIWHRVSATLGQTSPVIDYYMARNQLRFIAKHWSGVASFRLYSVSVLRTLLSIAAFTLKSHGGQRLPHRNARLLALRDAIQGRWGEMGYDVAAVCCLSC